MIWDNFRIALAAIRANKMRSLLTTLGIIIGVAAVIAVVSIVQGLNYVIATQLEGVGAAYIRVHWREDETNPDLAGREVVLTYEDGLAIFERATALEYFNPIFFRGEQLRFSDQRHATTMLGVGASHQEVNNHWVDRGRFFSQLDLDRRARVCIIGRDIIDELELGDEPLGKEIIVGQATFTVVGVMQEMGEIFGQSRDDLLLIPITTARDLYGYESFKRLILDFQATSAEPSPSPRTRSPRCCATATASRRAPRTTSGWCSRRRSWRPPARSWARSPAWSPAWSASPCWSAASAS